MIKVVWILSCFFLMQNAFGQADITPGDSVAVSVHDSMVKEAKIANDSGMVAYHPRRFTRKNLDGIPRYFYKSRDYGSEALFNPVTALINSGFDILQLSNNDNRIFRFPFGRSARNTFINLARPDRAIRDVGLWKWTRTEVLPLTFNRDGAQWVPNYLLHFLGGGMTFVNLSEWYDAHKVPYPRLFAATTYMSAHLLNEIWENQGWEGTNSDAIADVYIFNIAGMILFTSPKVNYFFSNTLNMADWSLQPTMTIPHGSIQNQGQYFSFKYALPFEKRFHIWTRIGMGNLIGASYKIGDHYSISAGGGIRSHEIVLLDSSARQVTINTQPSAGIFLDKDNTVMASLVWSHARDNFMHANVYPGIIKLGRFSPGLWAIVGRDGYTAFGITSKYTFGIGFGAELNGGY